MMGAKYAALQHRYGELSYLLATFCVPPTVIGAPALFSHIVAKHVNYIPEVVESCFRMCGLEFATSMDIAQENVRYNLSQCKSIEDFAATCPTRTCADGKSAIATNNDVRTIRELTESYKTMIALFAKEASARARAQAQSASTPQPAAQVAEPAVHKAPQIALKTGKAWCRTVPKVAATVVEQPTVSTVSTDAQPVVTPVVAPVQQAPADSFAKAAEVALHDTQLQQEIASLKQQLVDQEASHFALIDQMRVELQAQIAAQMEAFAKMMKATA